MGISVPLKTPIEAWVYTMAIEDHAHPDVLLNVQIMCSFKDATELIKWKDSNYPLMITQQKDKGTNEDTNRNDDRIRC